MNEEVITINKRSAAVSSLMMEYVDMFCKCIYFFTLVKKCKLIMEITEF